MVPLWLLQVSDQLPRRRKDPASLLAAGKWISAPELVHIIDTAWKHAELDLQQECVTVQTRFSFLFFSSFLSTFRPADSCMMQPWPA